VSDSDSASGTPPQSPLFRTTQADRYERQAQIQAYEDATSRSLLVYHGPIHQPAITPFADAVGDIADGVPLDLMLTSPGGDGEAAKRMAAMCHSRRDDFRVVVPEIAASAATLLALAAESIAISTTSALGPVDPQIYLPLRQDFFPAKAIVELVDNLDNRTKDNPQAYLLYSALLGDVDGIAYQTAKAAIKRTGELIPEVLKLRVKPPNKQAVQKLIKSLQKPALHSATFGLAEAAQAGLPVEHMDPKSPEWDALWRLHASYVCRMGWNYQKVLVEGRRVSFSF